MASQNPLPFVYIDCKAAAYLLSRGVDPREMERWTQGVLKYIYTSLPDAPVDAAARLSALHVPVPSGEDRISDLPLALLHNIVSRLPAKDGARTAALSRRWRPLWRCTPLAFADVHLLPGVREPARADTPALAATISDILAAHPGPFRSVHLVCGYMDAYQEQLARWVQTLAAKGVQELVLVNRPWPLDVPFPAALFGVATLTRLYLGVWKCPDTSALPRGAAFPHLRVLVLCSVDMDSCDMDFFLAGSPALESLGILGSRKKGMHLRLVGQYLRCVQICMSYLQSIAVVDTPILERLFLWGSMTRQGSCIRVKIGHAPKLHLLGHLEPEIHMLEVPNALIKAGIRASPSTMYPFVRILGLRVRFAVRSDARMLATFLRCFPNVERLHIVSEKTDEITGKLNLRFWQENSPIESIRSCIKAMTFREFRGERSEVAFLKFFFQSAQVLKNAVVVASKGSFAATSEAISKVQNLTPEDLASKGCALMVYESEDPEEGGVWRFQVGLDFSVSDPFAYH